MKLYLGLWVVVDEVVQQASCCAEGVAAPAKYRHVCLLVSRQFSLLLLLLLCLLDQGVCVVAVVVAMGVLVVACSVCARGRANNFLLMARHVYVCVCVCFGERCVGLLCVCVCVCVCVCWRTLASRCCLMFWEMERKGQQVHGEAPLCSREWFLFFVEMGNGQQKKTK